MVPPTVKYHTIIIIMLFMITKINGVTIKSGHGGSDSVLT